MEGLGGWDVLLHLSWVISTQVSGQEGAFTHLRTSLVVGSGRCVYAIF